MVLHAGPGWESWGPAFGPSACSGTLPAASAAASADEWLDFLFFESLANAGVIAKTTRTTVFTRTGRISFLAICITNLLVSVRIKFDPDTLSKAYAVTSSEIDQERSVS